MKCPKCGDGNEVDLNVLKIEKVEVDRCPDCKGVWFDADELHAILEGDQHNGRTLLEKAPKPPGATNRKLPARAARVKNYCAYNPRATSTSPSTHAPAAAACGSTAANLNASRAEPPPLRQS